MTIQDILDAAANLPAEFQKGLAAVLPAEVRLAKDGSGTILPEVVDDCGVTMAGLNEKDDGLTLDNMGRPNKPVAWYAQTYFDSYWQPDKCGGFPSPCGILLFCQGVNLGDGEGAKLMQEAINDCGATPAITVDGGVGDKTLAAAMAIPDSMQLALAFLARNRTRYVAIVAANPADTKDEQGWLNRVANLQAQFCSGQQVATTATPPPAESAPAQGLQVNYDFQT